MIRAVFLGVALCCAPVLVQAQSLLDRLYDALEVPAYIEITRSEGLSDIDGLAQDMLGAKPTAAFSQQMDKIYDVERMQDTVRASLRDSLDDGTITALLIFLESETGLRIADLELAARKAFSDPSIEEAAKNRWFGAEESNPWLVARIGEIEQASDLIDRNVSGALNANLRFFEGLADGGGLQLSQSEMLQEVWGQEESIRASTTGWLGGYLMLAYEPLSEQDIADYIAFWGTNAGKALNAAIFEAFNAVYNDVSYATGRVIALNMGAQEL